MTQNVLQAYSIDLYNSLFSMIPAQTNSEAYYRLLAGRRGQRCLYW